MRCYESADGEVVDSSRSSRVRHVRKFYERLRVVEVFVGESLASQDAKDAADINFLMARFARTGEIPPATKPPVFQDNTVIPDSLGDALTLSRSTLATAAENLSVHEATVAQAKADKLAKDLAELDALRKASVSTVPGSVASDSV